MAQFKCLDASLSTPLLNVNIKQVIFIANFHTTLRSLRPKMRSVEYNLGHKVKSPKVHPILKHSKVHLIDEKGENLGEMDSVTALGIVQGLNLEAQQVKTHGLDARKQEEPQKNSTPIFKMISRKTIYDEEKLKRKIRKKQPQDIIKVFKFGTKITEHDFTHKFKQVVAVLTKGNSARIFVEMKTKGKWMEPDLFQQEREKRETMIASIAEKLKGIGVRTAEKSSLKKDVVTALFRPVHPTERVVDESEKEVGGDTEMKG